MENRTFRVVSAVCVAAFIAGCQSGPRFAWWKSDNKPEDTSLVARSAPVAPSTTATATLPSQMATPQTIAAASQAQAAPTATAPSMPYAAPMVPPTSAGTLTSAPVANYAAPPSAAAVAAAPTTAAYNTAGAGPTTAMAGSAPATGPYDPNQYLSQPPAQVAAAPPTTAPSVDRYGLSGSSPPPAGDRYATSGQASQYGEDQNSAGPDRYGMTASADASQADPTTDRYASPAPSTIADDRYSAPANRYATTPADRYASTTTAANSVATSEAASTIATPTASTIAENTAPSNNAGEVSTMSAPIGDRYAVRPSSTEVAATSPVDVPQEGTPQVASTTPQPTTPPTVAAQAPAVSSEVGGASGDVGNSESIAQVNVPAAPGQYRPGGTSSYTSPAIDVANRPLPTSSGAGTNVNPAPRYPVGPSSGAY